MNKTCFPRESLGTAYKLIKETSWSTGIVTKRLEPIQPNELLYDDKGNPVAIKSNGKILPIIEGDL